MVFGHLRNRSRIVSDALDQKCNTMSVCPCVRACVRACVSLQWGIADMVGGHVRYRWIELVELPRIGHFWNDSTSPARLMIFQRFCSVLKEFIFGITLRIWLRLT